MSPTTKRFPFSAFPTGWYAVAYSRGLGPGELLRCDYFGEEFVVYRTESGVVRATDAYCPHLGAHLGDGRVEGERIVCGFHGFQFGDEGQCVANAYGTKAPPKARLGTWHVRDRNQTILVWYDALGRPPSWEVPEIDFEGWTPLRGRVMQLATHPQETSENSVDFGHFREVHGFRDPRIEKEARAEGPLLTASYSAVRVIPGLRERGVRAYFDVFVYGLGYSLVHGQVPSVGLEFRQIVLSTPVAEERVDLRLSSTVKKYPVPGLGTVAQGITLAALWHEVSRDAPFWEHKRYIERPVLAKGDGPIPLYRRWAQQFYPEMDAEAAAE